MRITSKGQVTIPQDVREKAGLAPGTEVDIVIDSDGVVRIEKARTQTGRPSKGARAVARLRGAADLGYTTEEILRLTRGDDWGR